MRTERDALIRMGLLNKVARNDKKAVREALYEFFEKHLDPEMPHAAKANPLTATCVGAEFGGRSMGGRAMRNSLWFLSLVTGRGLSE
jgi:hypothetical protein